MPGQTLLRSLEQHSELTGADRHALLDLPQRSRTTEPGEYILREGERPQDCTLLVSGIALKNKIVGDGGRQVIGINFAGDLIDLDNLLLTQVDHNVQTVGRCEVAMIPCDHLLSLAFESPAVGRALWRETVISGSINREWMANLGRRNGRMKVAHMLCELALRSETAGRSSRSEFELPVSQDQLSDAVGLTPISMSRILKGLESDGLIERRRRVIRILEWERLKTAGDFNPAYLHLRPSLSGTDG